MKHSKKIAVIFIILLPLLFGFSNKKILFETHPYSLSYDTLAFEKPNIPADNPMTVEGVALGRFLFYDSLLSGNNKQSCSSCHLQHLAFSDGKRVSVGAYGDTLTKNAISLINLAWNNEYFWDGRERSLESLIRTPVTNQNEMRQDTIELINELNKHPYYPLLFQTAFGKQEITMDLVSKALAQFLRTIISNGVVLPDSIFPKLPAYVSDSKYMSQHIFDETLQGTFLRLSQRCSSCHRTRLYVGTEMGNDMVPEKGQKMKIPALVNIALTAPYMHDGRYKTLKEVMQHYEKHIDEFTTAKVSSDLPGIYFTDYDVEHAAEVMEMFNDSSIITNKSLSNPFAEINFNWKNYLQYIQTK
ncbi:MAG: cytochrome c peroxidase [Chitinophagales bacterium]